MFVFEAPDKVVAVINDEPLTAPLSTKLVGTVSVIISPTSARKSSIRATPSIYKSLHSLEAEPISYVSSSAGISEPGIFPNK